jgi:hypothetical protein
MCVQFHPWTQLVLSIYNSLEIFIYAQYNSFVLKHQITYIHVVTFH